MRTFLLHYWPELKHLYTHTFAKPLPVKDTNVYVLIIFELNENAMSLTKANLSN
jgi:hypothetical protein